MATKHDFHKVIIGRSEKLSFVDFGAHNIPAKSDTGAYRSAVHASDIRVENGILKFNLLGGHPICGLMATEITTDRFKEVKVANSFGHQELRYEVWLKVKLGPKIFSASFSLADRSKKIYPVLLGRKMLSHRFLVDSAESSLNRIELKKKHKIEFPADEEEGRNL